MPTTVIAPRAPATLSPSAPVVSANAVNGAAGAPLWEHDRVLLVVNDAHRPTPTPRLIAALDAACRDATGHGLAQARVEVAVATGAHTAPTAAAAAAALGPQAAADLAGRIHVPDADAATLDAGTTLRGTPVLVAPFLADFDVVVSLNSVEPHYFAGYTGTRKSVVPGLAARATITANHRYACEDAVAPRRLGGNPVAEDLEDAAARAPSAAGARGFALNVVSAAAGVTAGAAGSFKDVLTRLATEADAVFGRPVEQLFDIVVARAHAPYDQELYRCMKAFEHARLAVRPGGAFVLVAGCPSGAGAFRGDSVLERFGSARQAVRDGPNAYRLGDHQPIRFFGWLAAGHRAYFATPGLAPDAVRRWGARPVADAAAGVAAAATDLGLRDPSVLVIEDATNVLPVPPSRTDD